jgi:hypothetical protein
MKSFDILIDFVSKTWLKVSMSARFLTHKRARHRGGGETETDGTRITQRKIHRGRTGPRRERRRNGEVIRYVEVR